MTYDVVSFAAVPIEYQNAIRPAKASCISTLNGF